MGHFKQQFNNAFKAAPSFSMQAREHVKRQLLQKKKRRWMQISIVVAAAVALVSFIIWNDELLGRFNEQSPVSLAAPEHENKMEIFSEVIPDPTTQFSITNQMNSMNRGKEEYKGGITIETQFDEIQYGQVLLLEDEKRDNAYKYVLGRVIGKPGDKVAIEEGQLYLNDLPVDTFYGKAQIVGTTDVEEAFERLQKVNSTEWKESIEEALHYSLEPVVLKEDELFIVSDNWARNSVRKTFKIDQIEGIVIGYTDVIDGTRGWRLLNDEELKIFSELGKQRIDDLRKLGNQLVKDVEYINGNPREPNIITIDVDFNYLTDEIVDHQMTYYSYANIGNSMLLFEKGVNITYYHTELERNYIFPFSLVDGEWENIGHYME